MTSQTKYKVGDEVLYAGESCIISGVIVAYMVDDKNGELVGIQVAESMLDPIDEVAQ
jgi:hypothetical protein